MALTEYQRNICKLLAEGRKSGAGSYVAGGAALNELSSGSRISKDVDIFHDSASALQATWQVDRSSLQNSGFEITITRSNVEFIEAIIEKAGESVEMQWMRDSAFRFFPLIEHPDFGLTLHPFDLATNKVLALVGRVEVRDWVDTATCHQNVAPLGLLAWAACGKDAGWNPLFILDESMRTSRYSREEIDELQWDSGPPDFVELKTQWRTAVAEAKEMIDILPPEQVGTAVVDSAGAPFRGTTSELSAGIGSGAVRFHAGHIGGAWPRIVSLK